MKRYTTVRLMLLVMMSIFAPSFYGAQSSLFAQHWTQISDEEEPECGKIANRCAIFYAKQMEKNQLDSAKMVLDYWQLICAESEPLLRARLLWAIKSGSLSDSLFYEESLRYIAVYRDRIRESKWKHYNSYQYYKQYFGNVPFGQTFDKFTIQLATTLHSKYPEPSMEALLTGFYGIQHDTTIFKKLQTPSYSNTALGKQYNRRLVTVLKHPEFHMAILTGIWIPTGSLNLLGVHPEIGAQLGYKFKRWSFDVPVIAKFVNSPNNYQATLKDGSTITTKKFSGVLVGLDVGYDIYSRRRSEIQMLGGVAYDMITVVPYDEDDRDKELSAKSLNLNMGIGYRYYLTQYSYLGLRAKYNYVDYTRNDVIGLKGNVVTFEFSYGGLLDVSEFFLKGLDYKRRNF